jgi:predicted exporter
MKVKDGVSNSRVQYCASISGLIVLCLTARFCCPHSLKGQAVRYGNVSEL